MLLSFLRCHCTFAGPFPNARRPRLRSFREPPYFAVPRSNSVFLSRRVSQSRPQENEEGAEVNRLESGPGAQPTVSLAKPTVPKTAFALFADANRAAVLATLPSTWSQEKRRALSQELRNRWAEVAEDEKMKYELLAASARQAYQKQSIHHFESIMQHDIEAVSIPEKTAKPRPSKTQLLLKKLPEPSAEKPKLPLHAYNIFVRANRAVAAETAAANTPDGQISKVNTLRTLGEMWRQASDAEKKEYHDLAQASKISHENEMQTYLASRSLRDLALEEKKRALTKKLQPGRVARVARDPHAPILPPSVFALFVKQEAAGTKANMGLLSAKWAAMSQKEKRPFIVDAKARNKEYKEALKRFEQEMGGSRRKIKRHLSLALRADTAQNQQQKSSNDDLAEKEALPPQKPFTSYQLFLKETGILKAKRETNAESAFVVAARTWKELSEEKKKVQTLFIIFDFPNPRRAQI
ncbi:hypothetical protein BC830DRAFT_394320 [Chytriomyces sp. MP71]|nr:hypothetical protein BC830DRAFT_394320 [Chytriomyces sp. MP71]